MTRFSKDKPVWGHSNGSFKSSHVCPECIIKLERPIFYAGTYSLFKNFLYLPVGNFILSICLRMISQAHNVFDSISAHEFVKHLICKMAPSIMIMVLGVPNLLRIFLCKNPTTVLASFFGQATTSTHFDT